jgi:predicted ATPase
MAEPAKKASLKKITIKGFKSIESLVDFELRPLNVLIGANGAGKSNLVDFFRMLRAMAQEGLQGFILKAGGADGFFYLGPKHTKEISASLEFGDSTFHLGLLTIPDGKLMVVREGVETNGKFDFRAGALESGLKSISSMDSGGQSGGREAPEIWRPVYHAISNWTAYHFHDTTNLAPMRRYQPAYDKKLMRHDASNIAAFLLQLREKDKETYDRICDTIRLVAPFFDDFILDIETFGPEEKVKLAWRQKGSDFPFQPFHLSDGTIRFICLATALLQPDPPAAIVIDEPELGLHPYAISILGTLIQSAAEKTQVIVTTQSPGLLDQFEPQDIGVVRREHGHSVFERLDSDALKEWLDEYSVAELWEKNVLRAGPTHE